MDVQRAPAVVHRHVGRINSTPSKASNFCHTGCFLQALGSNEKNCGTRVMADLMLFARRKNIGDDALASTVPRDALDASVAERLCRRLWTFVRGGISHRRLTTAACRQRINKTGKRPGQN
jgi:hypothetical protein